MVMQQMRAQSRDNVGEYVMDPDVFKVLITGTTGFIGSHLAQKLTEQGHDVYGLERYVTGRYVLGNRREMKTVFGDLKEYYVVRDIVRQVQPDVIIHLAAVSAVAYSYQHPHEVMENNVLSTINLAEASLHETPNLRQFLFASTSETYGNGPCPKKEDTPQNPNSPYAVSKLASEKYLLYMREAYGFPVTVLRNFNTYGRKNNTHFVVERTVVQMLKNENVRLGDPIPVRDFLYVDDHVNSYLACLNNSNAIGEIFNFCTGKVISIKELVGKISQLTGYNKEICWDTIPRRPLDIKELVGDYSKANRVLGWEPKYSLEEGLKLTIDFWRQRLDCRTQ